MYKRQAPQLPIMRRLTLQNNPTIARVIRQVSAKYGLIADGGYTAADPNPDELYQVYSQPGHAHWVAEYKGEVVGGGGIVLLTRSRSDIYKLQKIYFLPAIHDKGLAKKLALMTIKQTREVDFKRCYLETTASLKEAIALYERLGFERIDYALGCTGYIDYEVRMLREL